MHQVTVKPVDIDEEEWDRISMLYQVLYGGVAQSDEDDRDGFNANAQKHIQRIR